MVIIPWKKDNQVSWEVIEEYDSSKNEISLPPGQQMADFSPAKLTNRRNLYSTKFWAGQTESCKEIRSSFSEEKEFIQSLKESWKPVILDNRTNQKIREIPEKKDFYHLKPRDGNEEYYGDIPCLEKFLSRGFKQIMRKGKQFIPVLSQRRKMLFWRQDTVFTIDKLIYHWCQGRGSRKISYLHRLQQE